MFAHHSGIPTVFTKITLAKRYTRAERGKKTYFGACVDRIFMKDHDEGLDSKTPETREKIVSANCQNFGNCTCFHTGNILCHFMSTRYFMSFYWRSPTTLPSHL